MTPLLEGESCSIYCGDSVAEPWPFDACDAIIVDAPYSPRTHAGHFADTANSGTDAADRRSLNYSAWTPGMVRRAVKAWAPKCTGWIISLTDDILAPAWRAAIEASGRLSFAPVPYVELGKCPRLTGDGPASWTIWIVVGRPRTREAASCGSLPGAYVLPEGQRQRTEVVGGKRPWLMRRLVQDYTLPGDLICDPCCGGGTTIRAAIDLGRRAVGIEADEGRARLSLASTAQQVLAL